MTKILIVEDETIVALDTKSTLTKLGYEVVDIVTNYDDAISSFLDKKPDIILMDIYRGLSQLKEVERTCITLFFMEDLPIEKIAVITGMPAGTIKSHLSRG